MYARFFASIVVVAAAATSAVPFGWPFPGHSLHTKFSNCALDGVSPTVPPNQSNVTVTAEVGTLKYVAIGYGTQNYTCTAGKYVSAGAIAKLYDVSCLAKTPIFSKLSAFMVDLPESALQFLTRTLSGSPLVLGDHYFITNSAGAIAPKFDFTSGSKKGDPTAYVIAKKLGGTPAPNTADIDYLELQGVEGSLAKYVFRVSTKAGQPPTSCTSGTKTVEYAAQYWFYG